METFLLKVITPQGEVFNEKVLNITLPGSEGEFGVYPKHASMLSTLKPGIIRITKTNNKTEAIVITWGYVKVGEHKVQVLIDEAIDIDGESNEKTIIDAVEKSKKLLKKALPDDAMMASISAQVEYIAKDIM